MGPRRRRLLAPVAWPAAVATAIPLHRLQGLDQDLALGVAQGRVGVDQQVAAGRHLRVGHHLGGVVGLAVVGVPGTRWRS